ncbi:hypothetical protein [Methylobacterium sp. SyP6R]|uniref:ApeA N-terminal domain 1-containing protein n=1 Tax=Methylobacterium sp. SyP6R TaxID=2718876 RepID=UPI001F491A85|nr:hypothetical protein [Methylobacterium sp. SyP6R]MCF4127558.1 hypothetical protein [Methylobacterium sp. SyP6R]
MELKNFEDWFAVRPRHDDKLDTLNGRLSFDLEKGIHLDTIQFSNPESSSSDIVVGQTITGYIDYQRPATIIQPWTQRTSGFGVGINTPVMRDSQRYVASAVLKNIHLENIDEPIFTGLIVEHPAIHAWVNPNLVESEWIRTKDWGSPRLSVDVRPPQQRDFTLADGTQVKVSSAIRVPGGEATTLEEYTIFEMIFTKPINLEAVTRINWRIDVIFEFLTGIRVSPPIYYLPTTYKRLWNQEDRQIVAEFWYQPISRKKRHIKLPSLHDRLSSESNFPISLKTLLDHIAGDSDELIYLSNLIQSVEDYDLTITQGYGELLGCLEAFDNRTYGSGADEKFKDKMAQLVDLVTKNGSSEDVDFFSRIKATASNKFSLLKRLERLHQMWHKDGFRANPNLRRIRDLRNIIPHGRGLEVSSDVAQEMVNYMKYLTALGRYHVYIILGLNGNQIAQIFSRQPHLYGIFVPNKNLTKVAVGPLEQQDKNDDKTSSAPS